MALVVRIEPNGSQVLLLFDNGRKDLQDNGWLTFVQRFEGFNLFVAQQFTLTFDGCRAKIGDIHLEISDRGMPISTLKPRWHDILIVVK
jgi:hypothetical protein